MSVIYTSADLPPGAREWFMQHLRVLVVAIVRKHGPLTVGAVQELANQLIIQHGIRDAHRFV